jgi:hypothetical protein
MTDLKIYKALEDLLCESKHFGKHYKNVTIQNINGENLAVSNTGVDLIQMLPADTIQEFNYFRELTDVKIQQKDFGGCNLDKFYTQNLLFVYYSKTQKSVDDIINKFERIINSSFDYTITPIRIITDKNKLVKSEFPKLKKNIEVKGITYIGIEFSITFDSDSSCYIDEC